MWHVGPLNQHKTEKVKFTKAACEAALMKVHRKLILKVARWPRHTACKTSRLSCARCLCNGRLLQISHVWSTFDKHCRSDRRLKWSGRQTFRVRVGQDDSGADRWLCIRGSVLRLRDKRQPSFWHRQSVINDSLQRLAAAVPLRAQRATGTSSTTFVPSAWKLYPRRWGTFGSFAHPSHLGDLPRCQKKQKKKQQLGFKAFLFFFCFFL